MLWLNPSTGDVMEAPNRPSPAWVTVVGAEIVGENVESTLEGLRRAMMMSDAYPLRPNDFEWVGKTGLNVYAHEKWWFETITDARFPYLIINLASDGTLEIRYDEKAKDDTSKDTIRTKEISDDDSPLKRGGQRGTGKSGQKGGPSEDNRVNGGQVTNQVTNQVMNPPMNRAMSLPINQVMNLQQNLRQTLRKNEMLTKKVKIMPTKFPMS